MKLSPEVKFEPGYYLITFKSGQGLIVSDIEYDGGLDLITGQKVAVDGLDGGGGIISIDATEARMLEPIGPEKLEHAVNISSAKAAAVRIGAQVELAVAMRQGKEVGVVQDAPAPTDESNVKRGPGAVSPPSR